MPASSSHTAALGAVEKLKALLEREPALRGEELAKAVEEKERLITALEVEIKAGGEGELERAMALNEQLAPLAFANNLSFKVNSLRLQLSRIQAPKAKPAPVAPDGPRVDIIS